MSDNDSSDEELQMRLKMKKYYSSKTNKKIVDDVGQTSGNTTEPVKEKDGDPRNTVNMEEGGADNGQETVIRNEVDDMLNELRHISGERNLDGYHSEYDSNSDYKTSSGESESEDDEKDNNDIDKIIRYPIFNKEGDWKTFEPVVGLRAADVDDMHYLISCYAIDKGYDIRFGKRDRTRLVAKCAPNCAWSCRSSWMQNERSFQVKTMVTNHTCVRNFSTRLATANWLARQFALTIRDDPKTKVRELQKKAKEDFKVEVSFDMCARAKKKAFVEVDSALKQHYSRLWDYGLEILRSNPGSTITFKTQDRVDHSTPAIFERAYVCFDALKKGWLNGCRPVIGLDGCFLKTFVKGQLLTAVGRDGNNHMFPIAWAVVESENYSSWTYFLSQLKEDLGTAYGGGWTLLTDRQKGLIPAINDLLPNAEHRFCARHVYANFRKHFTGVALRNLFWSAAKCGTVDEFQKILGEIRAHNVLAYEWICKNEPMNWARCYFSCDTTCDSVENNMSECFNSYILEARQKPIINMLEEIRQALMKRLCDKKEMLMKLTDNGGRARNPDAEPNPNQVIAVSRKHRRMRCSNCNEFDHNARGCKNARVENGIDLDRRRKKLKIDKSTEPVQNQATASIPIVLTQTQSSISNAANVNANAGDVNAGTQNSFAITVALGKKDPKSPIVWRGKVVQIRTSIAAKSIADAISTPNGSQVQGSQASSATMPNTNRSSPRIAAQRKILF